MRNKRGRRRVLPLLLAAVLVAGAAAAQMAAAGEAASASFRYEYVLRPKGTDTDGKTDGKAVLELYAVVKITEGSADPDTPAGPLLDAGAFGLRFPDWVTADFAPDSGISIQPMVPEQRYSDGLTISGKTYHAFAWTGAMTEGSLGTIDPGWKFDVNCGGYALKLGTYTLTLPVSKTEGEVTSYRLPARSEVGQLGWLDAAEAIPKEVDPAAAAADPDDILNRTIWNPETKCYQGYYAAPGAASAEDALLVQTDIGFSFAPPSSWPSLLRILSYDPKKQVTVSLKDADGNEVAAPAAGSWSADQKDTDSVYAAEGAQADSGVGLYYTAVDLEYYGMNVGESYTMTIKKEGHLPVTFSLTATSSALSAAEGYPENGTIRLIAGDINPVRAGTSGADGGTGTKVIFGDGRIDMADRAAVMRFLGGLASPDPVMERLADATADNTKLMYYADIDGDGRVTQADLAILMSPLNFGQSNAG